MDIHTEAPSPDWTIPQMWEETYSEKDHTTWKTLYGRQVTEALPGRACDQFLKGLDALDLSGGVPNFEVVNEKLSALTGWKVVAVPGLVPDKVFFDHLANRRFPAGNFIRKPEQLDYLQEPDIFHDVFGHVPMLTDPVFADYMQAYGRGGQKALQLDALKNLARLYWYTVEFGLLETPRGLRIYGAGILSSKTETIYSVESPEPLRIMLNLERVMRTLYKIDDFQENYFVIKSIQALMDATAPDFTPIYEKLRGQEDIPWGTITLEDELVPRNIRFS
ncbi:MAG: phenylalanine 4-monooxygenase [Nitrososphaera sp.]|nr:phenylalanine 4-monooxygenase [Nitrososphaera sp.]